MTGKTDAKKQKRKNAATKPQQEQLRAKYSSRKSVAGSVPNTGGLINSGSLGAPHPAMKHGIQQ